MPYDVSVAAGIPPRTVRDSCEDVTVELENPKRLTEFVDRDGGSVE